MDFKGLLLAKTKEVEQVVYSYLPGKEGYQSLVFDAMDYAVKAGGKRLRPLLMKESFDLFKGNSSAISSFMAAIEFIHTYSLIHDDLPAMDNDDMRRGMPTTHKKYGEAMGILAGDALLNYAFEVASIAVCDNAGDANVAKAFVILSRKAGIYGMIGGQVVDVLAEKSPDGPMTEDKLDFIFRLKTGALVEASMMVGAILAGASDEEVTVMEQVASKIGMAFQIQDDILDVVSTEEELGKPIGSDEKNGKETYVTLHGLEVSKQMVAKLTEEAISLLVGLGKEDAFLKELLASLVNRTK